MVKLINRIFQTGSLFIQFLDLLGHLVDNLGLYFIFIEKNKFVLEIEKQSFVTISLIILFQIAEIFHPRVNIIQHLDLSLFHFHKEVGNINIPNKSGDIEGGR